MSLEGRKVAYAVTHTSVFIPGLGGVGPTLTAGTPGEKLKDLAMSIQGAFLVLTITGRQDVVIPMTNVSHMTLVKD